MLTGWNNCTCLCGHVLLLSWNTVVTDAVKGHTAGVRCVVVLNSIEIMSCSDDSTVRRWNTSDGTCTQTCGPHTTSILSVASLPDSTDVVCCTADHTLQIWRGETLKQTVALPEPSPPVICVLSNGDVVTSSWSVAITNKQTPVFCRTTWISRHQKL